MRIISKFKDYYDIGLQMGVDEDITYVRKETFLPELEKGEKEDRSYLRGWTAKETRLASGEYYIGFCGTVRSLVCLEKGGYTNPEHVVCYSVEDYNKYRDLGFSARRTSGGDYYYRNRFFETYEDHDQFRKHGVPIFVDVDYRFTVLNPCLKWFDFAKVVDAYTAFQEVSMYVSGVLGIEGNKMVEIEDKYRLAGHGYDKSSFRMDKDSKPNRKRRKNKNS